MHWIYLALGAAIFLSLASMLEKKILRHEHAFEFSVAFSPLVAVLTWLTLGSRFVPPQNPVVWLIIYIASWCGVFSFYFSCKTVRHLQISSSSPILALAPGVTAVLAFVLLGEKFGIWQLAGLLVMLFGAMWIESVPSRVVIWLRKMYTSGVGLVAVLSLLAYGFGTIFDKTITTHMGVEPISYLIIVQTMIAFNMMFLMFLSGQDMRLIKHAYKTQGPWLFLVALVIMIHRVFYIEAVALASISLVVAVKRSSVVWTTLSGFFFHDDHIVRKTLASVIILIGLYILLFL